MSSDWRRLLKALRVAGFELRYGKSGHLKVYNQRGRLLCTLPQTPSDYRALLNARSDLRRYAGFTEVR